MTHDLTTTLRSELAALEYKRDRLMSEVNRLRYVPKPIGRSINPWLYRLGPRDEESGEISRAADRGAAGGGRPASRAGCQAKCHRFEPEETYTGCFIRRLPFHVSH